MKTLALAFLLFAAPGGGLAPFDETVMRQVIAANKGKVILFDFWATWCEPCRAEMPKIVALEAKLHDKGLKLVSVSADEPEQEADALKFLQKNKAPMPSFIKRVKNDDKFINSIDPKWSGALPAFFLYDRNGRKLRSFIGETPTAELEAAIRKAL